MKVHDFLRHPELWSEPERFEPFVESFRYFDPGVSDAKGAAEWLCRSLFMVDREARIDSDASDRIAREIEDASRVVRGDFDQEPIDVFVMGTSRENSFLTEMMNGVGGYAAPGAILIYLYPEANWHGHVRRTVVHELNHSIRYPFGYPSTFLNWTVFEGLAELYVSETYPHEPLSPWTMSASESEIERHLPEIKRFWRDDEMPTDAREWFFGDIDRKIPLWLGYSLGFHVVSAYRRENPSMPWKDLIRVSSETIAAPFL